MEIKGINELKKAFEKHNGEDAVISISHKLYRGEKFKCKFNYIFDEKRIGFYMKRGQEFYVYKDEMLCYGINNNHIYFEDDVMHVDIIFNTVRN